MGKEHHRVILLMSGLQKDGVSATGFLRFPEIFAKQEQERELRSCNMWCFLVHGNIARSSNSPAIPSCAGCCLQDLRDHTSNPIALMFVWVCVYIYIYLCVYE